jgi:Predicted spermidine synthase with an N-terminal membrane domain
MAKLASESVPFKRMPRWFVVYALAVHAAMLGYDLVQPAVFLNADRAKQRLESIQGFITAVHNGGNELVQYLTSHGILGDYVVQGLVFGLSGQYGVIVFQLVLLFLSLFSLFRLVYLITRSKSLALSGTIIYFHFPHSLILPHQLASEAVFNPLLVIAFYSLAYALLIQQSRLPIFLSAILFGLTTLIRPVTLLWPIFTAIVLITLFKFRKVTISSVIIAMAPILIWMSFVWGTTGVFSMSSSGHDMPHNLYNRVWVIANQLPDEEKERVQIEYLKDGNQQEGVLSVSQYASFVFNYPVPYFEHLARDGLAFCFKSGIERVFLDYLVLSDIARNKLQSKYTGWRRQVESQGLINTLRHLFRADPKTVIVSALGSVLFAVLMVFVLLGIISIARGAMLHLWGASANALLLMIAAFPFYIFLRFPSSYRHAIEA